MTSWKIEPCTLADAPALAPNNMMAFWATDANWKLGWTLQDVTLDFLIENFHDRIPNNLLKDRETLRHYKAVDPETGALMGYARWMLPASCADSPHWADGQIAEVSEEEREAIRVRNEAAWWKPMHMDGLDDCGPEKKRILEEGEYISLEYLAVHPDNTGKGVASALVKHGVELGKKTGVDLFILAFQAALNIYKRQGFKVIHSAYQDDTKYGGVGYWVNLLTYEVDKPKDKKPDDENAAEP
ncbi:acetyltransferase [Colletotrichum karsti]|uniref:Acetyltransferase n=1 Tax=Colletotrichum karsti TaxID=1095194 RepID=A0A9P6LI87_9PEZI|nr:acetyltransferase [Colletotrichum karsti]KAF9873405.1 acetyltransferase [Colletotrichum karsti]